MTLATDKECMRNDHYNFKWIPLHFAKFYKLVISLNLISIINLRLRLAEFRCIYLRSMCTTTSLKKNAHMQQFLQVMANNRCMALCWFHDIKQQPMAPSGISSTYMQDKCTQYYDQEEYQASFSRLRPTLPSKWWIPYDCIGHYLEEISLWAPFRAVRRLSWRTANIFDEPSLTHESMRRLFAVPQNKGLIARNVSVVKAFKDIPTKEASDLNIQVIWLRKINKIKQSMG